MIHEFECEVCWFRSRIETELMPSLVGLFDEFRRRHAEARPACAAEIDEMCGHDVTGRDPIQGCGIETDYGRLLCGLPTMHDGPHRYVVPGPWTRKAKRS